MFWSNVQQVLLHEVTKSCHFLWNASVGPAKGIKVSMDAL